MKSCLICDDHAMMLEALAGTVAMHWPDATVRLARDFPSAWAEAQQTPEIVLCDLGMPGATPLDGIAKLATIAPAAHIIIVTANEDDALLRQLFALGVHGFIPKASTGALVEAAIRVVLAGERYVPSRVLELLDDTLPTRPQPQSDTARLSERQIEILRLMAAGCSNKEIARGVGLAPATIKTHVATIIGVLGVGNRTAAAARARELGLL